MRHHIARFSFSSQEDSCYRSALMLKQERPRSDCASEPWSECARTISFGDEIPRLLCPPSFPSSTSFIRPNFDRRLFDPDPSSVPIKSGTPTLWRCSMVVLALANFELQHRLIGLWRLPNGNRLLRTGQCWHGTIVVNWKCFWKCLKHVNILGVILPDPEINWQQSLRTLTKRLGMSPDDYCVANAFVWIVCIPVLWPQIIA